MAQKKRRPSTREKRSGVVINILTLIVLVLLIFEGKSLISLFSHVDIQAQIRKEEEEVFASAGLVTSESSKKQNAGDPDGKDSSAPNAEGVSEENGNLPNTVGEPSDGNSDTNSDGNSDANSEEGNPSSVVPEDQSRSMGIPEGCDSYVKCIVPAQAKQVAESYFEDAVFVGDSRLEGFRNFSGISGTNFVTAVGMQLENFYDEPQISTAKGPVLPLQALKNMNFTKIYMMIGTNELGAYDMTTVRENYEHVVDDIKRLSSSTDPIVYIFGVFYVDENLSETSYVNNTNVDLVNTEILKMCDENGYHYINLNEVLSDGYSMIPGASDDGVHLNSEYCEKWLEYTRTHYLPQV